ncbi:hypothetical protein D3C85_931000 [compost metagenome]
MVQNQSSVAVAEPDPWGGDDPGAGRGVAGCAPDVQDAFGARLKAERDPVDCVVGAQSRAVGDRHLALAEIADVHA